MSSGESVTPTRRPRSPRTSAIVRLRQQQVGAVGEVDHQRDLHLAFQLVAVLQHLEQRKRAAIDLVVLEGALRVVHRDEFDQAHFHAFRGEIALLLRQVQELERRPADQRDAQRRLVGHAARKSQDCRRGKQRAGQD